MPTVLCSTGLVFGAPCFSGRRQDVVQRVPFRSNRTYMTPGATSGPETRPVVVQVPAPRQSNRPPAPAPVIHSPAYLYRMGTEELRSGDELDQEQPEASITMEEERETKRRVVDSGNALENFLASADEKLNDLERNPDPATEAIWKVSSSPVGETTAKGVRGAAQLTLKAGSEALKVVVPVAQWGAKQGFKLAVGLITSSGKSNKDRKKEKNGKIR